MLVVAGTGSKGRRRGNRAGGVQFGQQQQIVMTGRKHILAVASAGGHWQQMQQLREAFEGHSVHFVTTKEGLPQQFGVTAFSLVKDCNRNEKAAMLMCLAQLVRVMVRERPSIVISTGALPGYFALVLGKVMRARTIWVDSVANGEEFSMAGAKARRFADLWMSQWEHVADQTGAVFKGSVL
jgi:UDP-N-acetylglucosamine:LPS N-acetylglucosamine transferase